MRWIFYLVVLAALAACAGPGAPAVCTVERVATVPLVDDARHLVVVGRLNGSEARFILDTGAERSLVTPGAAQRHNLAHARGQAHINGLGGAVTAPIVFASIELGGVEVQREVPAAPLLGGETDDGVIGVDLLSDYDLEVSVPEHQVRLWRARHCEGNYVKWTGRFGTVPLRRTTGERLFIPATIDGVGVTALLDTGADRTLVSEDSARDRGVDLAGLATDPGGSSRGVDGNAVATHRHKFDSLTIGPETFRGVTVTVSALRLPQAEMLVGMDWLRRQRVWISWDARRVFIQPERLIPGSGAT